MHSPFVRLKRYAPGLRQAAHAHDAPHLSLVLAGGFEERSALAEVQVGTGRLGARPEGWRHAVAFGSAGGLVLTFSPPVDEAAAPAIRGPAWSSALPQARLRRLVPLLLEPGPDALDAGWDLLALAGHIAPERSPDPWLAAVRDRLIAAPGETRLTALARQAGRHRVSMGRAFMSAYGEPPSVFRRRMMVDRALGLAASGAPAVQAAVEAGFSDQSHFSRACRDAWGLAPGRLLAAAA